MKKSCVMELILAVCSFYTLHWSVINLIHAKAACLELYVIELKV